MKTIIANSNPILSDKIKRHFRSADYYHIEEKDNLSVETLDSIQPDFIFFPHWSYIIPKNIYENYNCVVFHMTDLPFGRGGSPLQNLISRKIYETKISAIKVVKDLDAGPVYLKKGFCLYGSAEEIYLRAGDLIIQMIDEIIETRPTPVEQQGSPVAFKRRTPDMSTIDKIETIEELFDHIRMLDADGYPKAFFENEIFRFEFSRASLKSNNTIIADVRISKK
jgi:methionyl-tRNA formyltransferase